MLTLKLPDLFWENPGNTLGFSILLGYALFVWTRTNAFVEYMNLLGLSRFFHIDEYNKLSLEGYSESYLSFLREYWADCFFVRLVVCPICVGFWLGLVLLLFFGVSPVTIPLGLFFFGIFNKLI
jgi:hypothetical protein